MSYTLTLTDSDVDTLAWVEGRYCWSDALRSMDVGENVIPENEAWEISEAFASDDAPFPCLDMASSLAEKLLSFWDSIV